jgi:hypothetical protein
MDYSFISPQFKPTSRTFLVWQFLLIVESARHIGLEIIASGIVDLAILELGATGAIGGDVDLTIGRYIAPFRREEATSSPFSYLMIKNRIYTF